MNIIKRFISKVFKVLVVLLVFFTLNVTPIKAETEYTDDNIFYAIGSFINSTQKGISRRLNEIDIVNLGKKYARTLMDNGSRITDIVKVRGNEFLFNPYGKTNIENAIDSVYGTYKDFANYAVSKVEDNRYIVKINNTYTVIHDGDLIYDKMGFMIVWADLQGGISNSYLDYHTIDKKNIERFNNYSIYGGDRAIPEQKIQTYTRNILGDRIHTNSFKNGSFTGSLDDIDGVGAGVAWTLANANNNRLSMNIDSVVFHNALYNSDVDVVPYNREDIPTKEEFVTNIEESYEPNRFYTYNFEEILNENTVINNEYITNKYITVEEVVDDDDDDDDDDTGTGVVGEDYTSLLDKILASIKALPDEIIDRLDIPEGSGEEGGGFWSGLFGAIGDLVSGMSDFLTSIPNLFIELFDGLLGLVEKVVELFVPSAEQVEELKGSLELLVSDLTGKFDFVIEPVNQIKTVYSEPKSVYDLTIEYNEQVIHVVPSFLKSSLDKLKVLLNGSVVLFTFISIYKRFVGREDVIK